MTRRGWMVGLAVALAGLFALPARAVTVVYVVRHAEKMETPGDQNPALSEAGLARARELRRVLGDVDLAAIYATQYQRTRQTVAPLVLAKGVAMTERDSSLVRQTAEEVRARHKDRTVLMCAHSNTIPALLRAFGVRTDLEVGDDEYDNLFVVIIDDEGKATMQRLRYGERSK